jgi:hypothetical protein
VISLYFIFNGTRLGAMIAAIITWIITWITPIFLLTDNTYTWLKGIMLLVVIIIAQLEHNVQ